MNWRDLKLTSIFFLITNALFFLVGIGNFSKISYKATIISILIASLVSYILLSFYLSKVKNCKLEEKSNIFVDIFKFLLLLIVLNYTLDKTTAFITYNVVNSISIYMTSFVFLIISVFIVHKGFPTISKSAFIYLLLDIFLIIITLLLLFPKMNFNNILPLVDSKTSSIVISSFIYLIIAITPYMYLPLFKEVIDKEKIKSIKKGFLVTHGFIFFYTLVIFSILGVNLVNIYPYPEVAIFKKVSFLNIVDRVESIFSISYFLSLFLFFSISFYLMFSIVRYYFKVKKEGKLLVLLAFFVFFVNEILNISVFNFLVVLILLLISFLVTTKSVKS